MFKAINNDEGSLKVGISAGDHVWAIGQTIRILGENKTRKVTYMMGEGEKKHLCFKGQGKVEVGEVEYEIVDAE